MFKVTNKGTKKGFIEIFWVTHLKVFNVDFDRVFVCWVLLLLPFVRKIPLFKKNTGIYRGLHNLNLK